MRVLDKLPVSYYVGFFCGTLTTVLLMTGVVVAWTMGYL